MKDKVFAATKWCVFKPIGREVTDDWVLEAVKERCRRLGGRVELLQFHWYDVSVCSLPCIRSNVHSSHLQYGAKEYLDILVKLVSLTKTHPELISTVGLCNFDSGHVQEACDYLLSKTGDIGLVSNQIQVGATPFDLPPLVDEGIVFCHRFTAPLADVFSNSQVWLETAHIRLICRYRPSQSNLRLT